MAKIIKQLPHLPNPDKAGHETWSADRSILNFPHPYRCLITGNPNSGKTTSVLNILLKAKPTFDNIFILHPELFDSNASEADELKNNNILIADGPDGKPVQIAEYAGVHFTGALRYFPSETYFDEIKKKKNLIIIDDIEIRNYIKRRPYREKRINKLFSYTSTHRSLSIIITCQDVYSQIIPCIYRFCNIFILYKFSDKNQIALLARNIGMSKKDLEKLFTLCKSQHDSICLDKTINSPYPYRFNIINPVEVVNE
jgi:hypothetical protein